MAQITIYSSAGDGYIRNTNSDNNACRSATSGTSCDYTGTQEFIGILNQTSPSFLYYIDRSFLVFDTSQIPAGATITGVTLQIYVTSVTNTEGVQRTIALVGGTQASTSSLTVDDFGSVGTTLFAPAVDIQGLTTNAYNTLTLNATGLSAINVSGYTKLALRIYNASDGFEPTPGNDKGSGITVVTSEQTGVTQDPKLVIDYNPNTTTSTSTSTSTTSTTSSTSTTISLTTSTSTTTTSTSTTTTSTSTTSTTSSTSTTTTSTTTTSSSTTTTSSSTTMPFSIAVDNV